MKPTAITERITAYLRMIKFSHSIFALPFAFTSALIAAEGIPPPSKVFWITVAMVGARSGAMGFNRVADRRLDALNPRTAQRELPAGRISVRAALLFSALSFAVLVFSAYMLNPLCLLLSPVAIALAVFYSYTKRLTWASHLVLGVAIAAAPLGAWIAVTGGFIPGALLPALAVVFWLAGFDILYALQDREFDKTHGLYSVPARFGIERSLWISRFFHLLSWDFLLLTGFVFGLGFFYGLGLIIAGGLFIYEHALLKPHDLGKLDIAFFNMNGYIGLTVFTATLLDYLL